MKSRRFEVMAFSALLLAVVSLALGLQQAHPSAAQAPEGQPTTSGEPAQANDTAAVSDIGRTFNYQGILRLADGSLADGSFAMTLSIYDQISGGVLLHREPFDDVVVRDGIFNVLLGANASKPIGPTVFSAAPRYLGIAIGPDPELLPRQRIHPVPWALMADTLPAGATTSGNLTVSGVLRVTDDLRVGDKVGIGLSDPRAVLHVYETIYDYNTGLKVDAAPNENPNIVLAVDGQNAANIRVDDSGADHLQIQVSPSFGSALETAIDIAPSGTVDIKGDLKVHDASPVLITRIANVPHDERVNTQISSSKYHCVATGWSASYDTQEDGTQYNVLWTYTSGGTWWLRVQFASHRNNELADVDVLCFRQEIASWMGASTGLDDPD